MDQHNYDGDNDNYFNYDDDAYEQHNTLDLFDEEYNPEINSMTSSNVEPHPEVNQFNVQNEQHLNLIYRRMVAGLCFRLPNSATCPDDVFESWMATFMAEAVDDPNGKSKCFRYTWTQTKKSGFDIPVLKYHVAGDIATFCNMVKSNNLVQRTMIKLPDGSFPNKTNWDTALKLNIFTPVAIKKDVDSGIPNDIPATDPKYLSIIDGIVNYLTGDYYCQGLSKPNPGFVAQQYFMDYDENLKVLKYVYKVGKETIPTDMLPSFKDGTYFNYRATVSAIKRRYGRGHTQETMIDWFRKLDQALNNNNPTEFKIQHLRTLITEKFITDPNKFPVCSDFEGDELVQKYPEEFSPMIATLLHYITFISQLNRSDWDKIQRLYHLEIKGKVDYKAWHENRSELYRVIDEFKAQKPSNINYTDISPNNNEIEMIRRANNQPRARQQQNWRNQGRPQFQQRPNNQRIRPNQQYRPNPRPRAPPQRQNSGRPAPTQSYSQNRLKRMLCMSCSRWAGTNKYHIGPWGGGPNSNCPYDRSGNIRPGYKFITHIYGAPVENIQMIGYQDIECEGLEFASPSVNQISETENYLIGRALADQN